MIEIEKYLKGIPTKELYKDLFKPGMKKAGEALETVLDGANLILLPLKLLNTKSRIYFDRHMERYSEKLNLKEDLTDSKVPQYVGLPIIDKLVYLDENELAEAFINLLTKASFDETLKLVHPAFVSILNNLSSDEAKILFHYKNTDRIPFIDYYIHRYIEKIKKPDYYGTEGVKSREQLKELINYSTQNKEDTYIKAAYNLTGIEKEVELMYPENIDLYIDNLEFNGLISFERKVLNRDDLKKYDWLNENYQENREKIESTFDQFEEEEFELELDLRKGYIEFTELGKNFIRACIQD